MINYDSQAGQAALDLFHNENNELKKAIASATLIQDHNLLKALHKKRDQIISMAIADINKAGEKL